MSNIITYTLPLCTFAQPVVGGEFLIDTAGFSPVVPTTTPTATYDVDDYTPTLYELLVFSSVGPTLIASIPIDGNIHNISDEVKSVGSTATIFCAVSGDWKSGGSYRLLSTSLVIDSFYGVVGGTWVESIGPITLDPEAPWIVCYVDGQGSQSMDSCRGVSIADTENNSCTMSLALNLPSPPSLAYSILPGDDFYDIVQITLPYLNENLLLKDYTTQTNEPFQQDSPVSSTCWFTFVAPSSGTVTLSTLESVGVDLDTVISVYTGTTITDLTLIGYNDDYDGGTLSFLSIAVTAGVAYRIQVSPYEGTPVDLPFTLRIQYI